MTLNRLRQQIDRIDLKLLRLLNRRASAALRIGRLKKKQSLPVYDSRREQEVLDCLLENLANKEIADRLNISERTVKFHVSNLLSKFGVRRRADLILLSMQGRAVATPTS